MLKHGLRYYIIEEAPVHKRNCKKVIFTLWQNIVYRTTAPESILDIFIEGNSMCRQCKGFCILLQRVVAELHNN